MHQVLVELLCSSTMKKSKLGKKRCKLYSWRRKGEPGNLMLDTRLMLKEIRRGSAQKCNERNGALRARPHQLNFQFNKTMIRNYRKAHTTQEGNKQL